MSQLSPALHVLISPRMTGSQIQYIISQRYEMGTQHTTHHGHTLLRDANPDDLREKGDV